MNPYEILDVPRDANQEDVRKAFRRQARKKHPDAGGKPEEFKKLHRAYLVLADDARRARFDQTGTVDEDEPDNTLPRSVNVIAGIFLNAVRALADAGRDASAEDMIAHIQKCLGDVVNQMATQRRLIQDTIERLKKTLGRFETEEAENFLDRMVRVHLANLTRQLSQADEQIAMHKEAQKFLKKYRYGFDSPQQLVEQWAAQMKARGATATANGTTMHFRFG